MNGMDIHTGNQLEEFMMMKSRVVFIKDQENKNTELFDVLRSIIQLHECKV